MIVKGKMSINHENINKSQLFSEHINGDLNPLWFWRNGYSDMLLPQEEKLPRKEITFGDVPQAA